MNENGNMTQQLLSSQLQTSTPLIDNKKSETLIVDKQKDEPTMITQKDIGDLSSVQLPYDKTLTNNYIEGVGYLYEVKKTIIDEEKETFCSYSLYFVLIIIFFGYIGYYLANNRIIQPELLNGINLGVLVGIIIVSLLWSSISEQN
uniref:Uncharacterized protein n=1 Tax=viral metagenome TaxID=1070528 RepID=A0A6C0E049_9ZZZZ